MKAALITIVDNVNFGTYLQAYATYRKLKERGYDVTVVNYERPYLTPMIEVKKNIKNPKWNFVRKVAYASSYLIIEPFMRWNLKRFLKTNCRLTKCCKTEFEITDSVEGYDIFVTGSDQVWNTTHNHGIDRNFFWAGIEGRKYSYAASIGIEQFPDEQKKEIYQLLKQYKAISVRENSAVKCLSEIGIDNAIQVLDPTLLLRGEDWNSIQKSKIKKTEPYLLVYSVEPKRIDFLRKQVQAIAKEKNLKVYVVCPSLKFKKDWGADKVFNFSTVDDFLYLFANADFVVVSSFHGTAFSINFNKEFITVSSGAFNSRVHSLLSLVGLTERYTTDRILFSNELREIDYNRVNSILDNERKKSENFIDIIQ